ncbi:MAG: tripartite tricarboxylate transporter substrate binding protein [Betaproteobacteria bacterium]|nr:tripartite tricarboxylate transporter substrate binding protein [Betaproteobacteria bacterium]
MVNDAKKKLLAACAVIGALISGAAQAQAYPTKPIRLLVPFAPGGSSDIVSRSFATEMSKILGQSVVVESKPGGAGNIAMQETKNSPPDGYTIILGHVGTLAVNPAMFAKLPYDPVKDFAPITMLAKVPSLLVVNSEKMKAKNLKELVEYAKKNPGALNYGSAGNGSSGHLAMAYIALTAGFTATHVPYKGTGPMMTDLLAGRTDGTFTGAPPLMAHVKAGTLRPIAIGTAKRSPAMPDVPTVAEQGYPGFETSQWYGLIAPAGMPDAIIQKLQQAAVAAGKTKEVSERLSAEAAEPQTSTPKEFADFIAVEAKRWGEVVKKSQIKAD